MKKIDKLMVELNCFNREQRVDEVMIKLSVKERKAHVRMLLRAEKVLAR